MPASTAKEYLDAYWDWKLPVKPEEIARKAKVFVQKDERLVGKGLCGGKRAAFSTASSPVRRRRIVHKSTDPRFFVFCFLVFLFRVR